MTKQLMLAGVVLLLLVSPGMAAEVGGVDLADEVTIGEAKLLLNGGGIRKKFFVKVYVGGLYLAQKSADPAAIVAADAPMAITLDITSGMLSTKKMTDAMTEGFEKSTGGNPDQFADQIKQFHTFFADEIKVKDRFVISYVPQTGLQVSKNGQDKGTITGVDFKKAVFGIWLGAEPADKKLKTGMLGN